MNSKKASVQPMTKKNTGIYDEKVITKLGFEGIHIRLSMGDFRLIIPDEVAKDRTITDFLGKMISVKGDIDGTDFTVSEWLD